MAVLEVSIDQHVAEVTLCRAQARNALDPELVLALAEAWPRLKADEQVRAIVVTGAPGSTFCSGFDLGTTIPLMTGARQPESEPERRLVSDLDALGVATLRDFDCGKPVIAAVNGHAIAGGMELMLACDLRVVAEGVKLGLSEVALGLIPAMGGTARLARHLPPAVAAEMLLTARPMLSGDPLLGGLINRLVPVEQVRETAMEMAEAIAANAPLAAQAARSVMRAAADLSDQEALALEAAESARLAATEDAREGPLAFLEKRPPVFTGH